MPNIAASLFMLLRLTDQQGGGTSGAAYTFVVKNQATVRSLRLSGRSGSRNDSAFSNANVVPWEVKHPRVTTVANLRIVSYSWKVQYTSNIELLRSVSIFSSIAGTPSCHSQ
jgi:hypothetical protein